LTTNIHFACFALDHNYNSTFTEVARSAYNLPQLMKPPKTTT